MSDQTYVTTADEAAAIWTGPQAIGYETVDSALLPLFTWSVGSLVTVVAVVAGVWFVTKKKKR